MAANLFISYSHQEAPFADSLLDHLEDRGFNVWVDYQDLTPARPWSDEITRGIEGADTILLVVSQSSTVSQFVTGEMRKAIELKKRIILLIFEAVKLPPELEQCEWIDFRGSFTKGLDDLIKQGVSGAEQKARPPQKGFKAPWIVWLAFVVSLPACLMALPTFWTLYIPYYLVPLPYRILKRDFNFFHVQLALILLPFALFVSIGVFERGAFSTGIVLSLFLSILLVPVLLLLIRTSGMRRWGKPIASRPRFANLQHPKVEKIRPVTYAIDAASEDQRYADDIFQVLKKYGHRYVESDQEAEVTFILISRYKTSTACDPEKQIVYPVVLQSVTGLDPKLQRIQWIDFRSGLRNIDVLAQLLPEPAMIFKSLGIAPMGNQTVLPSIIQALTVYLITLGIFILGSWIVTMFKLRRFLHGGDFVIQLICLLVSVGTIFFTTQSLINRKNRLASLHYLILVICVVGVSVLVSLVGFATQVGETHNPANSGTSLMVLFTYIFGLILIVLLALKNWKDLRRWSPRRSRAGKPTATQV
jgi:hypothetical protein